MSRRLALGAALAVLSITLGGCTAGQGGGPAPAVGDALKLVKPDTLLVCSDVPYEPFALVDESSPLGYSGFEIDLLDAIAQEMDLQLEVIDEAFDGMVSGELMANRACDVAAGAMTITEERREKLDFSAPYYESLQSLLVRVDSKITSLGDLDGKVIGVIADTTSELYAEENGPSGSVIAPYPSDEEMWPAMQTGQLDAILQDLPANVMHQRAEKKYTVVETYETDEEYGFAFAKGERTELRKALNDALAAVRADGTYDTLYDTYFGVE